MYLKSLSLDKQSESNSEPSRFNLLNHETSALFEDILKHNVRLRVKVTGRSMAPFLQGGEILTIEKVPDSSLCIGDLIFFRTLDGVLLIHRIVRKKMRNNLYIFQTKGDALLNIDDLVSETEIIGKVCRIEKTASGGAMKQIDLESGLWRTMNYFLAVINFGKAEISSAFLKSGFYTSFRHIIKKIFYLLRSS